jgi:hypothetical protein
MPLPLFMGIARQATKAEAVLVHLLSAIEFKPIHPS